MGTRTKHANNCVAENVLENAERFSNHTKAADVVSLRFSSEPTVGRELLTWRMAQFGVMEVLSIAIGIALSEDCLAAIRKTSETAK